MAKQTGWWLVWLAGVGLAGAELEVWYLRHAEAGHNVAADYRARGVPTNAWPAWVGNPEAFTPEGQDQAVALVTGLPPAGYFDLIAVSPLWRTRQTILPYLRATGQHAELWPELAETRNFAAEAKGESEPPRAEFLAGKSGLAVAPGEEAFFRLREDDGGRRIFDTWPTTRTEALLLADRVAERLAVRAGTNRMAVLLVGHGNASLTLLRRLTGDADFHGRHLGNTRVWTARGSVGDMRVEQYNLLPPLPGPTATVVRVLYIGNSQLYTCDVPGMVEALAASAGAGALVIESGRAFRGGCGLAGYWEAGDGPDTARGRLAEGGWDVVVLQEAYDVWNEPFAAYAERWVAEVRARGARPVLLATAGMASAYPEGFLRLNETLTTWATERGLVCASAGLTWLTHLGPSPARDDVLRLYHPDQQHPGLRGSYLYACLLYAHITGGDPSGLTHTIAGAGAEGLSADEAARMQAVAWEHYREDLRRVPGGIDSHPLGED
jgi:broad specificity phosphatase PhoE